MPLLQQIEVATFFQLPSFQIIGLPGPEVAEAKERVRSAIEASQMEFPRKRVILNLSPASIRKRGTGLDLAMALAVLALGDSWDVHLAAWGELGLDGKVKAAGQLTRTLYAAWQGQVTYLLLSRDEYEKAASALRWIGESHELSGTPPILVPVTSLEEAWQLIAQRELESFRTTRIEGANLNQGFAEQTSVESPAGTSPKNSPRAEEGGSSLLTLSPFLERMIGVAAAGQHHFFLLGPRGTGKSHALEWFIAVHPPVSPADRLHHHLLAELAESSSRTHSDGDNLPIRRVSSQVRPAALIGGANSVQIRPGEYSLAHGGILIADELPEWPRDSRESLREPLERGKVTLSRVQGSLELSARFLLAANGNLCPCGGWPLQMPVTIKKLSRCRCTLTARQNYLAKLSGPILDRMDMIVLFTEPPVPQNADTLASERLQFLLKKVLATQKFLKARWGNIPGRLSGADLEALVRKYPNWNKLLDDLNFISLRSRHKILKLALTLSAWDEADSPSPSHFMEAFFYRPERYLLLE
jgi:magnesium chelatase family protein